MKEEFMCKGRVENLGCSAMVYRGSFHNVCNCEIAPAATAALVAVRAVFGSSLARAVVSTIIPHKSILSAGTASTFAEEYMDFKMPKVIGLSSAMETCSAKAKACEKCSKDLDHSFRSPPR